jgi:hypothetical protein
VPGVARYVKFTAEVVGHGGPVRNPGNAMDRAIQSAGG